ncbi:MAG: NAD(+) synthase [Bacteroidetes bacterium]|nr:NAD(+) synthase [Bacteroidota bacterium]
MKTYKNLNELNYLSVMLISPDIKAADIEYNKKLIIDEIEKHANNTNLLVFPELCLTGSTIGDYFFNDDLPKKIDAAIYDILIESYNFHATIILGTCVCINQKLINCALFISDGKLLGIVPKNSCSRWFNLPDVDKIMINGYDVKVSNNLIFQSFCKIGICFGKENITFLNDSEIVICFETLPYIFNKNDQEIIKAISNINNQAIFYIGANSNESTTDYFYFNELFACECGKNIEGDRTNYNCNKFEVDIDIIRGERKHNKIFNGQNTIYNFKNEVVKFDFLDKDFSKINRKYADPFNANDISNDPRLVELILPIQAFALAKRMKAINCKSVVIGVSAGIDSTLALLVAIKTFNILGLDKKNIYAISMPAPATSIETNEISKKLCNALGVSYSVIPITDSVKQHLKDIGHNNKDLDIVYENTQARMRTMILLNIANQKKGIVVGTGDMSEIALGWNTFNGDHISNYNVNAGIPKTVAKAMLSAIINTSWLSNIANNQIKNILEKPISPELIPADKTGKIQATEEILGSYELHDFFLYYYIKYFLSEEKILYIANLTFAEKYTNDIIKSTFQTFLKRFKLSQYKRNCSVDGPSIFGISLSPRGGLVLPSDM